MFGLKSFDPNRFHQLGLDDQIFHPGADRFGDPGHYRIGFRMHGGHIQRIGAAANPQEPRGLFEGLGAEASYSGQLDARAELAVRVAVLDDLLRCPLCDARHIAQQRVRGRVEVDADAVDARFHRAFQALHQLLLIYVMLILAHAD